MKNKYFIYARKSSESDERQAQSIDSQVDFAHAIAKKKELHIVGEYTEARSAKNPNNRPEFLAMIEAVRKGYADSIIVWKIDRLARNPEEAGVILGMLQRGEIKSIQTNGHEYKPEDNAILSSVEFASAGQYSRDLSTNVKRGLQDKLKKGWRPGTAPVGYLNTQTEARGENYIIKDPLRFPLLRRAWELLLTGNYTVEEVREILNTKWGFRTKQQNSRGNTPIARSTLHKVFTNPFYAGFIEYSGTYQKGAHDPMVTEEEYDTVQLILGNKGRPRPQRYAYAYTGAISCGECGGFVSATHKEKIIKSTGKKKNYDLYYCSCSRSKKDKNCTQRTYTNVESLEEEIEKELLSITMHPQIAEWALEVLDEQSQEEKEVDAKILSSIKNRIQSVEHTLSGLIDMRAGGLIDDDTFSTKQTTLLKEKKSLERELRAHETHHEQVLETAKGAVAFAVRAHAQFLHGDAKTKRQILSDLTDDLNPTLKDKKLSIKAAKWFVEIKKHYPPAERKIRVLELEKLSIGGTKEAKSILGPLMRERRDLNSQPLA